MDGSGGRKLVRGMWANSLGTLLSRLLGLVRDVATASLLGQGGVMDALVAALRVPNFSRRFFGEGALAASLMPVLQQERHTDPRQAWQLLSTLLVALAALLLILVVLGEGVLLACNWWGAGRGPLAELTAITFPYLLFICLAAQVAAGLQSVGKFRAAALAPALLNVCWLAAAWLIAPRWSGDAEAQGRVLAGAILVSGVMQLAVLLAALRRAGFRFQPDLRASAPAVWQVARGTLPIALGLGITQITTLVDSLLAVALAAPAGSQQPVWWLGSALDYPLETGAAAAIYYGERFYQLPVGVLGLAISTVLYPAMARHAAQGDRASVGADLTSGLRLVWFTALPAGVGLMLLAEPIVRLLFVRGAFTAQDGERAAATIACYASAAWAYCALPLLVRSFYALGQRGLPLRAGLVAVAVDLAATLLLIWPLGERGLAISTALAAVVQVVVLACLFSRLDSRIGWRSLSITLVKGTLATAAMGLAVVVWRESWLAPPASQSHAWQLGGAIATGASVYLLTAWLLRMPELGLLGLRSRSHQASHPEEPRPAPHFGQPRATRGSQLVRQ